MRRRSIVRHISQAAVCLGLILFGAPALFARPPVEIILLADQTPSVQMGARRWVETFSALGVTGVQIRARDGEKVGIESRGTEQAPSYRVIGQLSGATELVLPGGRFAPTDRAKLTKWLDELGTNGAAGVTEKKGAFGLLAKQLGEVRDDLGQPLNFAPKGVAAADAVAKIGRILKLSVTIESDAQQSLDNDEAVRDDLDGLSCGTALAAILRPAGAVLRPRQTAGGQLEYVVAKAQAGAESWPIGWPPEQPDGKILPALLESHKIGISNVAVTDAAAAIGKALKAPLLWDHNTILKDRIDLKKTVSIPDRKTYYSTALRQVLSQASLKYSVRVDDSGKPLIWISSLKSP